MILFFVLINRPDYREMAVTEVHLAVLILYSMTLVAVIIGMIQVICMFLFCFFFLATFYFYEIG